MLNENGFVENRAYVLQCLGKESSKYWRRKTGES